jgi:hypothetical protein
MQAVELKCLQTRGASRLPRAMYFEIEGSSARLGGTMHVIPKQRRLAAWVSDAISWAHLIYLEHDKQESDWGLFSQPMSLPLAQRLPRSWPRIQREYPERVADLAMRRPVAVAREVMDPVPFDPGVERLVSPWRSRRTLIHRRSPLAEPLPS